MDQLIEADSKRGLSSIISRTAIKRAVENIMAKVLLSLCMLQLMFA